MSIVKSSYGKLADGREVCCYTLENGNGMKMDVIPYGCRILNLFTKDKDGNLGDVVLGRPSLEEYFGADFQGSFIGRYGNRIGNAKFTLNGETYPLAKNDGENTLHGGPGGYHQVLWEVAETGGENEPFVVFSHVSPDGDEGYPGTLKMQVKYTLSKENGLILEYFAETDKETIFNPTNHAFFNLSGNHSKDILDTELQIFAATSTAVSDDLIPTGEIIPVKDTVLDFTKAKKFGQDMFSEEHTIKICGGFDHNYCADNSEQGFRKIAEAYEPESGRVMEVFSCLPGVQLYTMNSAGGKNKDGSDMKPHTSFCLETQYYPDSPNHENFPFDTVKPGETFSCKTEYRFSVK